MNLIFKFIFNIKLRFKKVIKIKFFINNKKVKLIKILKNIKYI